MKGSSCTDGVEARRGDDIVLNRDNGDIGEWSSSCVVRLNVMCPLPDGVMGDAWRERDMQFVGDSAPLDDGGPFVRTGDGLFPPSKLSPRLNSLSKLPRTLALALRLLSLLPYGPKDSPDGREVTVEFRGLAPMGSSGSRLCLVDLGDLGGERKEPWLRSSVDEMPMLSVPSVSVSCLVNGAMCTGTAG